MYLPTIGLEIHVQLKTQTKLFCSCKNASGADKTPNVNVCPVCLGHPGTLPVLNHSAVDLILKLGLALNCEIPNFSKFDRKNYFYPDLPKGYQISQFDQPIAINGHLDLLNKDKTTKRIRIQRLHLEEDAGKLLHEEGNDNALVDFNRAGTPLIELVTYPDFHSAIDVKTFCQELQLIVRYLDISNADMEKGQMRCEVNVSVSKTDKLGTKVEVKNLNSFKVVEKAVDYEINRQSRALDNNEVINLETRGWDDERLVTYSQRSKEESHDYRYFPEPDLPPLKDLQTRSQELRRYITELPLAKRYRFLMEYELSYDTAYLLTNDNDLSNYVEQVISELQAWVNSTHPGADNENWDHVKGKLIKTCANWLTGELFRLLNLNQVFLRDIKITPENFAEFILLIHQSKVDTSSAKKLLEIMFNSGRDPSSILEEENLTAIDDASIIDKYIDEIIVANHQTILDYKNGKVNAINFLVGKVMHLSQGRIGPDLARKKIIDKIEISR